MNPDGQITSQVMPHTVASRERWLAAREALLEHEKELTRLRDRIARERRALPWVRIDKPYAFEAPEGRRTLAELFEGRSQLVVQHFMFAPGWEAGCPNCSFMADHIEGALPHLAARDIALVVVSRAPIGQIESFRRRMGWRFRWVSSHGSDFNHDFGVSFTPEQMASGAVDYNYRRQPFPAEEAPGISAFARDGQGKVFHTYSTYGRGVELMMGAYDFIDISARGRDEEGLAHPMAWVRHHDRYVEPASAPAAAASCCGTQR